MTLYKCDRCPTESQDKLNKLTLDLATDLLQVNQNTKKKEYDLCNSCAAEVRSLLNKR